MFKKTQTKSPENKADGKLWTMSDIRTLSGTQGCQKSAVRLLLEGKSSTCHTTDCNWMHRLQDSCSKVVYNNKYNTLHHSMKDSRNLGCYWKEKSSTFHIADENNTYTPLYR